MAASQLELEKLIAVGKELGLKGLELREFVNEERDILKEERDADRDARAKQRALEIEQQEKDKELKEKLIKLEMESKEKLEHEKTKQLELQLQIEQAKKSNSGTNGSSNSYSNKARTPKLPPFNQNKDDIDAYLHRFELYATSQGWNKETEWATSLAALLQGEGLFEYSALSPEDALNYEKVKKSVLKAYHLTTDGFKKKFREVRPTEGETGERFATRLQNYLKRWMELDKVDNFEKLQDMMLREQFLNSCNKDLATFLKEREPKTLKDMAKYANQYIEAHGGWHQGYFKNKGNTHNRIKQTRSQNSLVPKSTSGLEKKTTPVSKGQSSQSSQNTGRKHTCYICGRYGHYARDCSNRPTVAAMSAPVEQLAERVLKSMTDQFKSAQFQSECEAASDQGIASCMIGQSEKHYDEAKKEGYLTLKCGHQLPVLSYAYKGYQLQSIPIMEGKIGEQSVPVMRDTGCSGVVVNSRFVKPHQKTGVVHTCILIDGTVRKFPVCIINIDTPYFKGTVKAYYVDQPVCDLIVGNIPGARDASDPDPMWEQNPKGEIDKTVSHSDSVDEHPSTGAAVLTRNQAKQQTSKPFKKLKVASQIGIEVTAKLLIERQQEDPSLEKIRQLAKTGEVKVSKNGSSHKYIKSSGILYREFNSPRIELGNTFRQVVVPLDYRKHVLKVAHESILGGHQGVKKTTDKVMSNFTWPGMQADINRYCKSCDVCQRSLPKGRVTKVPLGCVPLIHEPFERVAVDIVGPINPITERGHRYILVMVDYATRYPEAVPMKSIETEAVAEALMGMYSRLGFPKEMLTDQGSQFVSNVMKEVSRLLSIRRLTTTPYHAMCNGLCEKFNGTLKLMLKKMCQEQPTDWDRYIDPLLFAYREAPQESTGFSPFELLYGRTVRGPMVILKELWTGESEESESKNVYQYVLDLQDRLEETCQLAREELGKSKQRYKSYYNRKARVRELKVGEEVLLLLPTDSNKLLMQWKGPFPVVDKVNTMNYKIDMGHRKKTFHINLLKKYTRRAETMASVVEVCTPPQEIFMIACAAVIEEVTEEAGPGELQNFSNDDLIHLPPLVQKEFVRDVRINPVLSLSKSEQAREAISEFDDVLTDIPGKTDLGEHVIKVKETEPVRSKPYPMPHALRKEVKEELQTMLQMGVISHSDSPYASPLTVVSKPDGSKRVCVDMRKINQITVFDAEPIPDQEEIFTQLAKDRYFTKIDLSKGYWQIPMAEESKHLTSFVSHDGLFLFNTMPFGLVNAAATFSRVMRKLLRGLDCVHNYIDDILIHTETWEMHLQKVREVFTRLRRANLTARPTKCFIGFYEVEFLGHIVGRGVMKPKPDKIQAIQDAPRPVSKSQIRSFLGLSGYYRKFIHNFSTVAAPLSDCTKKGCPNRVKWGEDQEQSFTTLKGELSKSPILRLPDLSKQFTLRTDASEIGVGAILLQEFDGELFPVAYASKKLNDHQKGYSVMEKECLAVVWAVKKFEPYLYGREFIIETDHQPLTCVRKSKVANQRIMRWALALQPYRYRLKVIKGKDNVGADYLSRISESIQAGLLIIGFK